VISKSGRGLPQSKTQARFGWTKPAGGHRIFEIVLAPPKEK